MEAIDLGTPELLFETDGPLAWLTFNRPDARNALTWAMYGAMEQAADRVDASPDIRVLILKGAGDRAFVAGTDIAQFREFSKPAHPLEYEARIDRIMNRLEAVRCPTIAAVRGFAMGAGAAIAMVCDLRLFAADAQFGVPIARTLGNTLNAANFRRMVQLVGPGRAKELMFTARALTAAEAGLCGLANEVVAPDQLEPRARELALALAANAPLTIQVAKEAINRITRGDTSENQELILRAYLSEDFREGVAAFLEKRRPTWQGR